MLTHVPKNPYCDICQKAKMFKPPSRAVGGSTKVEAEKFGDHITADFIVTRDEDELGIDDEKSALVVKDIATGFMYVYPNARRTTNATVLAIKHFVGHTEEIGVFYSDNAPELISAMKILPCRHVLSRDYISKSNDQAERAVKSVLEETRVNLLQAGLNHWHWPHAARHWCFMQNVLATGRSTAAASPPEPARPPSTPAPADDSAAPEVVGSSTDAPAAAAAEPTPAEVPQQELRTALIKSEVL
jgi:hypothetical protein